MQIDNTVVPFNKCPAKSYKDENSQTLLGYNVYDHTYIVGLVARELIKYYPNLLKDFFPDGSELIAACHDVGKVSPTFYLKLTRPAYPLNYFDSSLIQLFDHLKDSENSSWGGHATVSAATLKDCIKDKYIYQIVGSHHGSLFKNIKRFHANDEVFGGDGWNNERLALINALKARLGCEFPAITSDTQARLLSGLTTVADWIGSGGKLSIPAIDAEKTFELDVEQAVIDAGFIKYSVVPNLSFSDVFGSTFQPNEIQAQFFSNATMNGLNFIEASMGMGKTEAALYFAYECLEQGKANGIYFALPTQLTSNKIYDRFNSFLKNILLDPSAKSKLLHSNAWLLDTTMGEEGEVGRSWFDGAKRGLLAPFAVGTIDQALLSVINVRHHFVRSLGLMGKVVILDELHSYDIYTNSIIDELIKHLLEMKCTVIILSATLTGERKLELLPQDNSFTPSTHYPSITTHSPLNSHTESFDIPITLDMEKQITVTISDSQNSISDAIERAIVGEYVLWIENTVDQAIEVYKSILTRSENTNIECGLIHSRFTMEDRQKIENNWVSVFGKNNSCRLNGMGQILVGTQILEQSLDIDADYLITQIAPIDFLLQRSGRLWRHQRQNRPENAICEMRIITPSFDEAVNDPLTAFSGSAYVYSPFVLLSTLKTLEKHFLIKKSLSIPYDISNLINETYSAIKLNDDPILAPYLHDLIHGNKYRAGLNELKSLARANLAKSGSSLNEKFIPQTRYIDSETIPLLLLASVGFHENGNIDYFQFLDGSIIRFNKNPPLKEMSIKLSSNVCFVNKKLVHSKIPQIIKINQTLDKIFKHHHNLQICVVNHSKVKLINGESLNDKFQFFYNAVIGLHKKPV